MATMQGAVLCRAMGASMLIGTDTTPERRRARGRLRGRGSASSPNRPPRGTTPDNTAELEHPVIVSIADAHDVHPSLVALKSAAEHGQIPMSAKRRNSCANLVAVVDDPLTDTGMHAIGTIDRNCRLIKGQLFLWPGSPGWEALRDVDGVIPGGESHE